MKGFTHQSTLISGKEYSRLNKQIAKDGSKKYFTRVLNHHFDNFNEIINELKERYTTVKFYKTRTMISGIYNYYVFYTNKK